MTNNSRSLGKKGVCKHCGKVDIVIKFRKKLTCATCLNPDERLKISDLVLTKSSMQFMTEEAP